MSEPTPETPDTPNSPEQAALELYHQLVNLSPDNGDRALLISIRLPNAQLVGDVWLSAEDVEQLIDGTLTIAQHRMAYGDPEPTTAPLPLAEDDLTDDAVDDLFSGIARLLGSDDGDL